MKGYDEERCNAAQAVEYLEVTFGQGISGHTGYVTHEVTETIALPGHGWPPLSLRRRIRARFEGRLPGKYVPAKSPVFGKFGPYGWEKATPGNMIELRWYRLAGVSLFSPSCGRSWLKICRKRSNFFCCSLSVSAGGGFVVSSFSSCLPLGSGASVHVGRSAAVCLAECVHARYLSSSS
jgi:hypothetical protein